MSLLVTNGRIDVEYFYPNDYKNSSENVVNGTVVKSRYPAIVVINNGISMHIVYRIKYYLLWK